MSCAWKKQIKKFVAFPGLTPLQPDAYAQPCKRASLSDPPHLSGLPTSRRKATKQNSCLWQYKMSLFRGYGRLLQTCQELIPSLFFFYHGWDRYNGFIIRTPQALCCLEGSTMSNLVHRRRRCARIVLHSILCLEGRTPQDRSGADTQTAPVGRRMCGILYPGCRFALPWAKRLLPFQGGYLGGTPEDRCLSMFIALR